MLGNKFVGFAKPPPFLSATVTGNSIDDSATIKGQDKNKRQQMQKYADEQKLIEGKEMENTKIIIYLTEDGNTKIETRLEDVTVWLTIDQMVELFQKSRSKINKQKNEVKRAV